MRRRIALLAVALLVVLSGCAAVGSDAVDPEALAEDADYEWDVDADVTVTVASDTYRAVYRIRNRSTLELYRFHRFNSERPLELSAVEFRYPNGTVVGSEAMSFETTRSRTVVTLPADEGTFAYTAPKTGKRIRIPTVVEEGSYEVILPPDARVRYFLLGRVTPGQYERTMVDGRIHLRWESPRGDRIVVRYYLVRDLLLFGSLVGVSGLVLVGGIAYFWLQLRALRRRRDEVGLDVDTDAGDDSGFGPF